MRCKAWIAAGFAVLAITMAPAAVAQSLQLRDTVTGLENAASRPTGVATVDVNGTDYIYVAGGASRISGFTMAANGDLTRVETVVDNAQLQLATVSGITAANIDGQAYLVAGSAGDNGISLFAIADDGQLTNTDNVRDSDSPDTFLVNPARHAFVSVGGNHYLITGSNNGTDTDVTGLSVFSISPGGQLTNVFNQVDTGDTNLRSLSGLEVREIDGTVYLFAAGFFDDGVSVFSVAADGQLTHITRTNTVFRPRSIATTRIGGTTYLYVAGQFGTPLDWGIRVFSVDNAGALTNVANIQQSQNPAFEFNGAEITVEGAFLYVSGFFDEGLSVFQIENNGSLTNVTNLAGSGTVPIDRPRRSAVVMVDGAPFMVVPLSNTSAVYVLEFVLSRPLPVISGPETPVNGDFAATITFNEDVTGMTSGDLTVSNGNIGVFQTLNARQYRANVFPTADGPVTINMAAGAAQDAGGGQSYAAAEYSVLFDTTPPNVTISGPESDVSGAFTATFTFNEDVTGFTADDIAVGNGAASNFQATNARVYSATITPATDGAVTVDVAAGVANDAAGNGNAVATQLSVNNDTTAPIPTITGPSGAVNGSFAATITFNEDVTGMAAGDLTVSNGNIGSFQPISAREYRASIFPTVNGSVTLDIAAGAAQDGTGNDSTAAAQFSVIYDTRAPGITISGPVGPVSGAFTATFTFNEDMTGFALEDISVGNGTASNFQSASGSVYTAQITAAGDGEVTVDVAAGAANDAAGNGNTAAAQYSVTKITTFTLTVGNSGVGEGTITSAPAGIDCGATCQAAFEQGTQVTLTAAAGNESRFSRWTSGPCVDSTDPTCAVTVNADQLVEARFVSENLPEGRIVAAALPGARSSYVGGPIVTVFFSVVSRATTPAQGCTITADNAAPFNFSYRAVDAGNSAIGGVNPFFDIQAGGVASFVLIMEPSAVTGNQGYTFLPNVVCENATLVPIDGINSVFLSISAAPPVPDVLAIAATPSNDGVVRIPESGNRIGFMAASAVNIGAGDGSAGPDQATITATVDTGAAALPVTLEVCESSPTGCVTPRGQASVQSVFDPDVAKTYTVFVRANGTETIPFAPATARVFLRFTDANGIIRSLTSAAIAAPAPAGGGAALVAAPVGRWSVLVHQAEGEWPPLRRGSLYVLDGGQALLDDGETVTRVLLDNISGGQESGRFGIGSSAGVWTREGRIATGSLDEPAENTFWGLRDERPVLAESWAGFAGSYGRLQLAADGTVSGVLDDCLVSGRPESSREGALDIQLMRCDAAGRYTGLVDLPLGDAPAALLIANEHQGWRLEAVR